MLSSTFDITVVGTDLPALIYGALASKLGYRVLVVGHDPRDVVAPMNLDVPLVRRPQLIYGLESSSFISETFADLAMLPEMRTKPLPYVPIAQLVMPELRMDIHGDSQIMHKEWTREFPEAVDLIERFFNKLEEINRALDKVLDDTPILPRPHKMGARLKTRNPIPDVQEVLEPLEPLMEDIASNERLRTALLALASGIALVPVPWKAFPISRLLWHLRNGLMRLDWGLDTVQKIFMDKIRMNAGDIKLRSVVTGLEVKGQGLFVWSKGIRKLILQGADGQPEEIGTSMVVLGRSTNLLLPVLKSASNTKGLVEEFSSFQPSHYLFTVNLLLSEEDFPAGMGDIVFVVVDPSKPLEDLNFLILQRNPAMAPQSAMSSEAVALAVSVFLPASLYTGEPYFLKQYGDMVVEVLRESLMPFLPDLDGRIFIPSLILDHNNRPTVDEAVIYPRYSYFEEDGLHAFNIPVLTRLDNTLFLSDEVCGATGFEGAFYAAREALRITKEKLKRKG